MRAVFYGLGSDGTVGANRNSIKIIGETPDMHAQGYFVLDSKKAGSTTVSHLRFGPRPIGSTYLVQEADFVACHQFGFLERIDVLGVAGHGATFLLNAPYGADEVWEHLPLHVRDEIVAKELRLWVVDATRVAREAGLGKRVNTVLQTCFFALADVLPTETAIAAIKDAIRATYAKRGEAVLERNFAAVDRALEGLAEVEVPAGATTSTRAPARVRRPVDFVQDVTLRCIAGRGDDLPVSALPVDGTFPTGTAQYEKRSIAQEIPIWDPSICIDCAKCALVCPHAAIRMKVFAPEALADAPDGFLSKEWKARDLPGMLMTIQVAPEDCTGCGICVETCPAHSKEEVKHKSINLEPKDEHLDVERERYEFFLSIPEIDRTLVAPGTIKGSQMLEPLFEYSGACEGCGETPYLKLLTQLFGDRMLVANATGCSSIYGGNLPTTPWSRDARRARAGVVELALRGQRRVRPRHAARARPAGARSARARSRSWRRISRTRFSRRSSRRRRESPHNARESPVSRSAAARSTHRRRDTCSRSPERSSGRRSGSSAATAGRTTSASAGSTTCSPRAVTSTCSSSTRRSTRTPAGRRRRRRLARPSRSSPPAASEPARRTSA